MKTKSFLFSMAVILWGSIAMAQQPVAKPTLISRLESAKQDCAWKARNLKGAPQANMLLHQRLMENVLEQLKAGQGVEQQKIDKAFAGHSA